MRATAQLEVRLGAVAVELAKDVVRHAVRLYTGVGEFEGLGVLVCRRLVLALAEVPVALRLDLLDDLERLDGRERRRL